MGVAMFIKIAFSKLFWLALYCSLAVLASKTNYESPLWLAVFIGFFSMLAAFDESMDKGNRYQWVAVHLFGMLLAVQLGVVRLW